MMQFLTRYFLLNTISKLGKTNLKFPFNINTTHRFLNECYVVQIYFKARDYFLLILNDVVLLWFRRNFTFIL